MQAVVLILNSNADLDQIAGEFHPNNRVKWAAGQALINANGNPVRIIVSNEPRVRREITAHETHDGVGFELETTEFEATPWEPGVVHGTIAATPAGLQFTPAAPPRQPVFTPEALFDFLAGTLRLAEARQIRERLTNALVASWPEHVGHPAPVPRERLTRIEHAVSLAQHIGDNEEYRTHQLGLGTIVARFVPLMRQLGRMVTQGPQPHNRAYSLDCNISREAFQLCGTVTVTVGEGDGPDF